MKSSHWIGAACLVAAPLVFACSSSDSSSDDQGPGDNGGNGGSSGKGSGGKAGHGGHSAGSGGAGGTAKGGGGGVGGGGGSARIRLVDQQQLGSNVILFVSVTNDSGAAMTGLTQTDFEVKEDNAALSKTESGLDIKAYPTDYVWRTLLVADTSKSIMDGNNLDSVVESTRTFAHHITAQNTQARQVSVAAFDGAHPLRPIVKASNGSGEIGYTAYGQRLDRALDRFLAPECTTNTNCNDLYYGERPQCSSGLCIDPSTNLYGAVTQGLYSVENAIQQEQRKGVPRGGALIVFTDGSDHSGYSTLAEVTAAIDKSRIFVFTVGLKGEIDETALETIGRDGSVVIQSMSELQNGMEQVWKRVQSVGEGIYLVSYCTPTRNGEHEISVKLKAFNDLLKVKFYASNDALCDPGAISTACAGKQCGEADGIYCGDCSGTSACEEGSCKLACTASACGTYSGYYNIDCGECKPGDTCDQGTCKGLCTNDDGDKMVCGQSPFDYNHSCGSCPSGETCNPKGTYCFAEGSNYCYEDGGFCGPGKYCYDSCILGEVRCCSGDASYTTSYVVYEGSCNGNYESCDFCVPNGTVQVKFNDGTWATCKEAYPYPCHINGEKKCCSNCP